MDSKYTHVVHPWSPQVKTQLELNPFANIESAARSPGATLCPGGAPTIRDPAVDTAPLQGTRDLSDPDSLIDVIFDGGIRGHHQDA